MTTSEKRRWEGYVAYMEERISAYNVLVDTSEGKCLLAISTHRWEDSIKIDVT
jgi:hypothetical protein